MRNFRAKSKAAAVALSLSALITTGAMLLSGQQDITGVITREGTQTIAITDFRGGGLTQRWMDGPDGFNATLWNDIADAGVFNMAPKTNYPLVVPQRPEDFRQPLVTQVREGEEPVVLKNAPWLTDWSGPPVNADLLAFGYVLPSATDPDSLVLRGWLFNVRQPDVQKAFMIGSTYIGTNDLEGAQKVAHEFAADILALMGIESLEGTRVYFISDRTGNKEVWSMEPDGSNQRQVTHYGSITTNPAVSPDGRTLAAVTLAKTESGERWQIRLHSTESGRNFNFYNPRAATIVTPSFSPDGKHVLFGASVGQYTQIIETDLDGANPQNLSQVNAIELAPKVNPKTGDNMVFVSARGGSPQLWIRNMNGTGLRRLTDGRGQVDDPNWSPDGLHVAFSWTAGYEIGAFNIFVMDVVSGQYVQLTSNAGVNENPSWAPDGKHLVYSSQRGRDVQIYTMLANGKNVKKLTSVGRNEQPIWAPKIVVDPQSPEGE